MPLPAPMDRVSILKALSAKMKLDGDVDLNSIGCSSRAEGYSGADCAALLREAGLAVLKESVNADDSEMKGAESSALCISAKNFDYAFNHVMPSVSKRDQARYDRIRDRIARARSRGDTVAEEQAVSEAGVADGNEATGKHNTSSNATEPADATESGANEASTPV